MVLAGNRHTWLDFASAGTRANHLLHPSQNQFDVHPARRKRIESPGSTPDEVPAQIRLGMHPRLTLEPRQVRRSRIPKPLRR